MLRFEFTFKFNLNKHRHLDLINKLHDAKKQNSDRNCKFPSKGISVYKIEKAELVKGYRFRELSLGMICLQTKFRKN